jgi:hypothetical protein
VTLHNQKKEMTMTPVRPFIGTIQVPTNILTELAKRKLTYSETRVVVAICCHAHLTPGRCQVSIQTLAKTLCTRKAVALDMVNHAVSKGIIQMNKSTMGTTSVVLCVIAPGELAVPG